MIGWLIAGGAILLVGLCLLARGFWENGRLQLERTVVSDKRLPQAFDGFTVAQISDFHNRKLKDGGRELSRLLTQVKPDIIVITGDLIDRRRRGVSNAETLLCLAQSVAPTFFVTGNHEARAKDFPRLEEILRREGVRVLRNEREELFRAGEKLTLAGLDDYDFTRAPKRERAERVGRTLTELTAGGGYCILLAHRPDLFPLYAQKGAHLSLCGHAHGGQVRLRNRGLIAPDQGFFPKYTGGIYERDGAKMLVSRGVGNSLIPIRLNNLPQITAVTLKTE